MRQFRLLRPAHKLAIWVVVLATTALVVTIVTGVTVPQSAERAYGGFVGLVILMLAVSWLRGSAASLSGDGPRFADVERVVDDSPADPHPTIVAAGTLESCLRLGTKTMGEYSRLVEPRLDAVAWLAMARRGVSLADPVRAGELLGDSYALVDPARSRRVDRFGPGVPLEHIAALLDRLEQLP